MVAWSATEGHLPKFELDLRTNSGNDPSRRELPGPALTLTVFGLSGNAERWMISQLSSVRHFDVRRRLNGEVSSNYVSYGKVSARVWGREFKLEKE
jgi:hypothetical protein